jgi:hypothetical protein
MIISKVFIVIESGFIFDSVIRIHQFTLVQTEAVKQLLALLPNQVRALCILALIPLETEGRYNVYSRV